MFRSGRHCGITFAYDPRFPVLVFLGLAMPQLFSRSSDTIFRTLLVSGAGALCLLGGGMLVLARSPYMTNQDTVVDQVVPFSHVHHVSDIGIDCRYCHQSVESSARAGVPSTQVCMNCHRQLWNQADMLQPVRISYREDKPLHWNRVHDLPDYVYFNHSVHIKKGVGCYECHGRVGEMPLMRRAAPLTMQWCLECHRDPVDHLRPAELVFAPKPLDELLVHKDRDALDELRQGIAQENRVHGKTDCYTCHR